MSKRITPQRITPEQVEALAARVHEDRDDTGGINRHPEEVEFMLWNLAAQMKADDQGRERSQGDVRVPAEIAQWVYHLLRRRLDNGKGTWLQPWSETELGQRDKRWVEALEAALGITPTPPPASTAPQEPQ